MTKLDHNTIPLSRTDQEPDTVLVDAYGDGSAVWLGLASDDPDVLNHADLSPAEARRLAFRLFVAADAARERLIDSIAVEVAVEEAVEGNFAALAQEPQGPHPCSAHEYDLPDVPLFDSVPESITRDQFNAALARAGASADFIADCADLTEFVVGAFEHPYDAPEYVCPLEHARPGQWRVYGVEDEIDVRAFDRFLGYNPAPAHWNDTPPVVRIDDDPEATRIIRDALAILGSQGSVARNWLINADGRVPFPRELPAGPGATCCLDGALNLAAFKTTPAEVASLDVAVQGRAADDDDVPAALRRAKARVRDAADTGSILYINGHGYDAAVAALERAL